MNVSLTLSSTVEHINSGDDKWASGWGGGGGGMGHRPKKICFLWKWGTILLMFEGGVVGSAH